ncbi:hypothetical protein [Allosphingosinicella sp.]|uniref:hypothetical protein n=1 Tax=Allosphingosinicella sp. TaxID=2823234 RepID=UPI003782D378
MMIILTAAALAAAQPAPAPQAPAGPMAGHAEHAAHGQMQHGQNCPCCEHSGSAQGHDCCDHAQHRGHDDRQ